MKSEKKNSILVLFTGIYFLLNAVFVSTSFSGDVLIIANKDVPINSISTNDIRSIFLGEKARWSNNQTIIFVILKTDIHEEFLRKYIGNTPAQYRNYWRKMVFTGKARSPKSFKDIDKLIDYITNTGGAIGYVPAEAYSENVKIISVK